MARWSHQPNNILGPLRTTIENNPKILIVKNIEYTTYIFKIVKSNIGSYFTGPNWYDHLFR